MKGDTKSAYLIEAEKGGYARIIFPGGGETQYLVSKRHAYEIGGGLVGIAMSQEEWEFVSEQINHSSLLDKHEGLEEMVNELEAERSEALCINEEWQRLSGKWENEGEEWNNCDE